MRRRFQAESLNRSGILIQTTLPHPGPLPLGEGELSSDSLNNLRRNWPHDQAATERQAKVISSPGGEDTGEGGLINSRVREALTQTLFQAESLGYSSRGQRPRSRLCNLHLPCRGNPKRELNYFGLPFQGAGSFWGVIRGRCPRL